MAGFCSQRSAQRLLRRRVAVRVLQTLDVPDDPRDQAEPLDPAEEVHLQPGLVAIARRQDDAVLAGVDLQDRADGGVDLGVHQHHVLAVAEGLEDDVGAELDRAGDVDDDVDLARSGRSGTDRRPRPAARPDRLPSSSAWESTLTTSSQPE